MADAGPDGGHPSCCLGCDGQPGTFRMVWRRARSPSLSASGARPKVKSGGRYQTAGVVIEVDSVELLPFAALTDEDVRVRVATDETGPDPMPRSLF